MNVAIECADGAGYRPAGAGASFGHPMSQVTAAAGEDGLRPELGLLDATMINVGTIIASSIFIVPSTIAAAFTASFPTILVWVVGAVVSLCGALCIAELGAAMPQAGGQFVYLRRAFGPVWGYLYGWGSAIVINPASIAAIAVGFATYLGFFVPLSGLAVKLVAAGSILLLTAINCFGLRVGALTQDVLTLIKIAAVVALVALCLLLPGGHLANFEPLWPRESAGSLVGPFGVAMIAVLFAYDGWIEITYVGSEMKDPARHMPSSIVASTVLVSVLYVGVSVAMLYVLGQARTAGSSLVAADAMRVVLGAGGATLITVAVLISTLGSNNGIVFTAARIPYAMARAGEFFPWAARLHPRYATPNTSLIVQGFWSALLALSGTYLQLITYMIFVSFLFYALSCVAVIVLRRREPGLPRPYRAWGYPVTPVVFILFSGYLIVNTIVEAPKDAAIGAALLLAGLPLYAWFRRRYAPA
ncbi:MAG: amino acid transporter [Gemmatimonadetes bacterium]|nr:MAG: amino acid transporter [Gemmatimonadota bacterium]